MNIENLNSELIRDGYLKKIFFFEQLDSTNNFAKQNDLGNDTLIITANQTNGVGRFNRQWISSPNKDLTFTLHKCIKIGIDEIHLINFYSSYILYLTVKDYMTKFHNPDIYLKWPNDIILNKKKIAGILLEVKDLNKSHKKFIIGIGLNVNNINFTEELKIKATSLINEINFEINPENVLINYIRKFYENIFLVNDKNKLMHTWISNTNLIGKKLNFRKADDDEYSIVTVFDIDHDGGINVKFEDGRIKKFYSGEISLSL